MNNNIALLLLLCFLAGCSTRTWVEATDTTRATGPTQETVTDRPLAGEYFELRTNLEPDGYTITESLPANDEGQIVIDLLPPAVQCLHYKHPVDIELWSYEQDQAVYTRTLNDTQARDVVREWSVQARLGQEILLRRATASMLDKLVDATTDQELRDQLEAIRVKVKIRLAWE